jgi:hypothetical protein
LAIGSKHVDNSVSAGARPLPQRPARDTTTETLKYYHDGQNVIAEYGMFDTLARRYVHGTSYVDERAVLLEGDGADDTLETYYYLLQELYTPVGLIKKNGTLAEAYTYDAYGKASVWGYRDFDFDRDGDVQGSGPDWDDWDEFMAAMEFEPEPKSGDTIPILAI